MLTKKLTITYTKNGNHSVILAQGIQDLSVRELQELNYFLTGYIAQTAMDLSTLANELDKNNLFKGAKNAIK